MNPLRSLYGPVETYLNSWIHGCDTYEPDHPVALSAQRLTQYWLVRCHLKGFVGDQVNVLPGGGLEFEEVAVSCCRPKLFFRNDSIALKHVLGNVMLQKIMGRPGSSCEQIT